MLQGIKVIELATVVMAPSCCAVLSDFGAEVIKIESPGGGDIYRYFHDLPSMPDSTIEYCWILDDRNKKSIVINLKSLEGQAIAHKLVSDADVFVTNFHNSVLEALHMDYETLRALNPRLIYAHGTGYGDSGEECEKPGYDAVSYWSRSGLEATLFPIDGELSSTGCGTGDHPTGIALFGAIMSGLYMREKSGAGRKVGTSLLAAGTWANSCAIQAQLVGATFHDKRQHVDSLNYTTIYYRPRDRKVMKLCIINETGCWRPFCEAMNRMEWLEDPRFAAQENRRKPENMKAFIEAIDASFDEHDYEYWDRRLTEYKIPFSPVASAAEVAADKQLRDIGVIVEFDHPRYGRMETVDSPIFIEGEAKRRPMAAPMLGEHTREVLESLSMPAADTASLLARGIVEAHADSAATGSR